MHFILKTTCIRKSGSRADVRAQIVLNISCRIPTDFASLGFDVLNINRVGYGGNPIPKSENPVFDSIPLYSELIKKAYEERSGGKGGVVLVGHSLGAATALIIAAQESDNLPILGVSALGIVPSKTPTQRVLDALEKAADADRVPMSRPSADGLLRFMGYPDYIDEEAFDEQLAPIFELGERSEGEPMRTHVLISYSCTERIAGVAESCNAGEVCNSNRAGGSCMYTRLDLDYSEMWLITSEQVPLQFLAAEVELGWLSVKEGQPKFDAATKLFTNAPRLEAEILLGGAHNFEFSKNSAVLRERRTRFIDSLVSINASRCTV